MASDAANRPRQLRWFFVVVVIALSLPLLSDLYVSKKLRAAYDRAKAAGMRVRRPPDPPVTARENAASTYTSISAGMRLIPHNLRYAEGGPDSSEPELAKQRRAWFKPYIARIGEANALPKLSWSSSKAATGLGLSIFVKGVVEEADWLVDEGHDDEAVGLMRQALRFFCRLYDEIDVDQWTTSLEEQILCRTVLEFVSDHPRDKKLAREFADLLAEPRPGPNPKGFIGRMAGAAHGFIAHAESFLYSPMNPARTSRPNLAILKIGLARDLAEAQLVNNYVDLYRVLPANVEDWPTVSPKVLAMEKSFASKSSGIEGIASRLMLVKPSELYESAYQMRVHNELIRAAIDLAANTPIDRPWPGAMPKSKSKPISFATSYVLDSDGSFTLSAPNAGQVRFPSHMKKAK